MMCPRSLVPGIQSLPNGMSNCPSHSQRPVRLVEPTDYSIPESIDWGVCQLPDYEIERQIREKREQEQRDKDRKEKDRISRLRKEERRRALRPQGPPPHNTDHKAELPCEQCDPHLQHEKPWYPPTDYDKPLERSPLCPVMDPRCPASLVPGAVGGGGYGAGGGYAPCANGGMDMGMGMGMGMGMPSMGSQCPATAYAGGGGGGGRHARASPCMAAILERERQERERQEREIRERLERERIERERKELERRERDLKARKPYMCPGQAQIEKAALKEAKKAHLAGKPLDQGGRGGNGYGELRQCAQGNGNHGYKQSPEERFGPCVPVGDLAPCDPRACPASSDKHIPLQETKSRELRGGVLYTGCDCNKRNGLQHDCKRTLCQGRPECLTKPEPMCIPSGGPGYISPCYPVCDPQCWDEAVQDRYC